MATRYPYAIDGYSDIRVVRDNIEEVVARDHNDSRSAIVAIEQTLGLVPQGTSGTVGTRLNQADLDFVLHITGTGHRHVAGHIDYLGSTPSQFADGYALPPARLDGTVTQIVAQLGLPAGSTKVGASAFDSRHSKFHFPAGSVSSQAVQAANYLDEESLVLQQSLAGFVVDGLAVTRTDASHANVAAGTACVKGRMLQYAGGLVATAPGTNSLYAYLASDGTLQVSRALVGGVDELMGANGFQPTVPLATFVETGASWTNSVDLRRYGMFANNKFLTVGNDGYGADFTSLRSALSYASLTRATTSGLNKTEKIVLIGNMVVADPLPIAVPSFVEIDGNGHAVHWDTDVELLDLTGSSNVTLRNIEAYYDGPVPGSTAAFAKIGNNGSVAAPVVSKFRILDCRQTNFGQTLPYFVKLVDDGSNGLNTGITNVEISGCSADAAVSHVWWTAPPSVSAPSFMRVADNDFHQRGVFASSSEADIHAGDFSVVSGNIVSGGFNKGIQIDGAQMVVSDNIINAGVSTQNGIGAFGSGLGTEYCIISGNAVICPLSSTMAAGIALNAQPAAQGTIVANNFVGGMGGSGGAPGNGIDAAGNPVAAIVGNMVSGLANGLGGNGIENVGGGSVVCANSITFPNSHGINVGSAQENMAICSNVIIGQDANGIQMALAYRSLIAGNVIKYSGGAFVSGLNGTMGNCAISGNLFYDNGGVNNSTGFSVSGSDNVLSGNMCIFGSMGISVDGGNSVVGNLVGGAKVGITTLGDGVHLAGNLVNGYTFTGIDPSVYKYNVVVGNMAKNPAAAGATGINLSSCDTTLAVGNWAEGGASSKGFLYTGATNIVLVGNLSFHGANPDAWSASSTIDNNSYFS
jgi:hypothetical protein